MTVVLDDAEGYAHSSSQCVWDNAAPAAVSASLHASRLDGSQLRDDSSNRWLPDLLISRPDLVGAVIALCKESTRWAH
jgi:3'(2'), 5'-bisphosphate nucleotidase